MSGDKVILQMTAEQAEQLLRAFREGRMDELGVVNVRQLEKNVCRDENTNQSNDETDNSAPAGRISKVNPLPVPVANPSFWKRLSYRRLLGGMSTACSLVMLFPVWAPPAYVTGLIASAVAGLMARRVRVGYALPSIGFLMNVTGIVLWPMAFGLFHTPDGYRIQYGNRNSITAVRDNAAQRFGKLQVVTSETDPDKGSAALNDIEILVGKDDVNIIKGYRATLPPEKRVQITKDQLQAMNAMFNPAPVPANDPSLRPAKPGEHPFALNEEERKVLEEMISPDQQNYEIPVGPQHIVVKSGNKVIFESNIIVPDGVVVTCAIKKGADNLFVVKFIPDITVP